MSATQYLDLFAEHYDLFHSGKDYAAEAGFLAQRLHAHRPGCQQLLELACGTGGHAFALEKLGFHVTATDYSTAMIARAQAKQQQSGSAVRFATADMRALALADGSFDAAVSLFDAIGYVLTNDALLATLRGVHRCLRPAGVFIFEFWHGPAMLRRFDPVRVRHWPTPGGRLLRISETSLDVRQQIGTVRYSIYQHNDDGSYRAYAEEHRNRFFSVPEMAGWLGQAGFTPLEWCAGFSADAAIDGDAWHILGVARKNAG